MSHLFCVYFRFHEMGYKTAKTINYRIYEYTVYHRMIELIHYVDIHVPHIQRNFDESNSRRYKKSSYQKFGVIQNEYIFAYYVKMIKK